MAIGYWKRNSEQSHNQTLELIHQKTFDPSDQLPSSNEVKQLKIRSVSSVDVTSKNERKSPYCNIQMNHSKGIEICKLIGWEISMIA